VIGVYIQCDDAFIYLEPVQRYEDGCDMRRFRSFNHSTCKTELAVGQKHWLWVKEWTVGQKNQLRSKGAAGCSESKGQIMTQRTICGLRDSPWIGGDHEDPRWVLYQD